MVRWGKISCSSGKVWSKQINAGSCYQLCKRLLMSDGVEVKVVELVEAIEREISPSRKPSSAPRSLPINREFPKKHKLPKEQKYPSEVFI